MATKSTFRISNSLLDVLVNTQNEIASLDQQIAAEDELVAIWDNLVEEKDRLVKAKEAAQAAYDKHHDQVYANADVKAALADIENTRKSLDGRPRGDASRAALNHYQQQVEAAIASELAPSMLALNAAEKAISEHLSTMRKPEYREAHKEFSRRLRK